MSGGERSTSALLAVNIEHNYRPFSGVSAGPNKELYSFPLSVLLIMRVPAHQTVKEYEDGKGCFEARKSWLPGFAVEVERKRVQRYKVILDDSLNERVKGLKAQGGQIWIRSFSDA